MVCAQPRIPPREWDAKTSLGFWDTNGSRNIGRTTRKKKKKKKRQRKKWTCPIVGFSVPDNHSLKIKECEKRYKYIMFAKERKKYHRIWRW